MENTVVVDDYAKMDKILREERNYMLQTIKKIRATGCNVLLIQKSILRDAVTDLALHYLVRPFAFRARRFASPSLPGLAVFPTLRSPCPRLPGPPLGAL
jgi:chaperonin GroEL (HSP60 family)